MIIQRSVRRIIFLPLVETRELQPLDYCSVNPPIVAERTNGKEQEKIPTRYDAVKPLFFQIRDSNTKRFSDFCLFVCLLRACVGGCAPDGWTINK